jgi:hypothetical protein
MADQTFTDTNTRNTSSGSPSHDFQNAAGGAASSVTDQARSAARDLKDKTIDVASTPTEAIKDQASDFVDAAKDAASHATDKFKETVDGQKNAGAEYVGSLADTMRRAAREFDNELPVAGTYIRKAASQVEHVSGSIRNGNFNDLVRSAQDFARRQPTAFLGMAVLAGFGTMRFLKSSAETSGSGGSGETSSHGMSGNRTSSGSMNRTGSDSSSSNRSSTHMSNGTPSRANPRSGQAVNEGYAMASPSNRSIPDLLSDALGQLAKLVGNEFALAKAELSKKASQAGRAAGMIGAGAVLAIPAVVLLLFAVSAALIRAGLSDPVAYLVAGGGAALISAILIWLGLSRLSRDALKPAVTLGQVERDKMAAKEMIR